MYEAARRFAERTFSAPFLMMRRLPFLIMLALATFATPSVAQPDAAAVFTGTVTDAETGAPLPAAHVFLAETMNGTTTDAKGRFRLSRVPRGAHRLFVSMLGFEPAHVDTLVTEDRAYTFEVRLTPAVLEMDAITIEAKADGKWRKRLEKFTRLFIGESPNADETTILNPEVLDFEANWWGKLTARATEPLVIENRALGYRIRYFLKEFSAAGGTIRYDGEPLFEPLEPESPEEEARWEENRRRAYFGSFRHFMRAALADSLEAAGFVAYRIPTRENPERSRVKLPLRVPWVFEDGPTPEERTLRFYGFIEVNYLREEEDEAFLRWMGAYYRRAPENQRSWLRLTDGPTTVDHMGEVVDPYGLTVYGYFAFERVADELPKEYRPD